MLALRPHRCQRRTDIRSLCLEGLWAGGRVFFLAVVVRLCLAALSSFTRLSTTHSKLRTYVINRCLDYIPNTNILYELDLHQRKDTDTHSAAGTGRR